MVLLYYQTWWWSLRSPESQAQTEYCIILHFQALISYSHDDEVSKVSVPFSTVVNSPCTIAATLRDAICSHNLGGFAKPVVSIARP